MDPTVELALDGFPLDPQDPDIRYHRELGSWLELEKTQTTPVAFRLGSPSERLGWLRPAVRRFAWVRAHKDLIAGDRKFDARLAHLISLLVNRLSMEKPEAGSAEEPFAELADQAAAIETSGGGSMLRADTARLLLELAKAGVQSADTRRSLHAMLRAFSPEDRHARMPELAWHLFLDDDDPDDGEPCWSARVRRDLREMKPTRRKPWISVLKLAPVRNVPDAKWHQRVNQALERLGREEFESRVSRWCECFQGPDPVNLERPGQVLLRLLIEMRSPAVAAVPGARWDSPRSEAFWAALIPLVNAERPPIVAKEAADRDSVLKELAQERYAGFEQAAEYTAREGYDAEIVAAVRKYQETLHGSVTDQARRQHVGWWLWLEDVTPIKADECWSSIVRADLRAFTGDRKKAWLALIGNMTFAVVTKPPAKWVKAAESAIGAIDPADFRQQIRRWMEPFKSGQPLRLSTPGRDVLRCLIWDCSLRGRDPELEEAQSWISMATWKNKESRDRMSKIVGPLNQVLSESHPDRVLAVSEPAPPKAPDLQAVMNKALSRMLAQMPLGDRIEIHPDHIFVRGERDHYRIGMDGVVTRRSGRKVRVDMDALPPYITQLVQPAIDALDLAQGMFQPNRMRLISLATILAHDAQYESAID